ncbi:Nucleoside-diphosphate-sugar epimerase [Planctomycetales bacterium 10988]|nr:Nucleoside-diphosphate-sugar epimerase [Planctomycetales bacterium 10988]
MAEERMLITGATGLVGRHTVERALREGLIVRAIVRANSDRSALTVPEGVDPARLEFAEADLAEPESFAEPLKSVDYVVHTAAKVGDWGDIEEYRKINCAALETMLTLAEKQGDLKRWIQISSLGVYPPRDHFGTDETAEINLQGTDGYVLTKAESEVILRQHIEQHGLKAVMLRPGFLYGPGDRQVLPRLIERWETGKPVLLFGDGKKVLNNTYVGHIVEAVFLALRNEDALGEAFNIRDERLVTREEFLNTVAEYLDKPHPKKIPLWLARPLTNAAEGFARLRNAKQAPMLTKARFKFLTLNLEYSIDKAKKVLGYKPYKDFQDGIREALDWATAQKGASSDEPTSVGTPS